MVVRANKAADGIGGHLSTFACSAALYEVGFNHFFRGKDDGRPATTSTSRATPHPASTPGPSSSTGWTRRTWTGSACEIDAGGRASPRYPHPRLMPDFWEYPTVSMGLGPDLVHLPGPVQQATCTTAASTTPPNSRVWCFLGDGECDEPETLGSISIGGARAPGQPDVGRQLQPPTPGRPGARQRQDHPGARGDLPGAGWNVIKVIWGSRLGRVARTRHRRRAAQPDEHHRGRPVPALRHRGRQPHPRALLRPRPPAAATWSSTSPTTTSASCPAAATTTASSTPRTGPPPRPPGVPTVILAKTVKGWTLGPDVEGRNATHQIKKMTTEQLLGLRDRLHLQDVIPDEAAGRRPAALRPAGPRTPRRRST